MPTQAARRPLYDAVATRRSKRLGLGACEGGVIELLARQHGRAEEQMVMGVGHAEQVSSEVTEHGADVCHDWAARGGFAVLGRLRCSTVSSVSLAGASFALGEVMMLNSTLCQVVGSMPANARCTSGSAAWAAT